MKYEIIFFVIMVQLIYVSESITSNRYVGPWATGDVINCESMRWPNYAYLLCEKQHDEKVVCYASCFRNRVFKGTNERRMTLRCYYGDPNESGLWKPRRNFPDCVHEENWPSNDWPEEK